jgi:hypothetical protein
MRRWGWSRRAPRSSTIVGETLVGYVNTATSLVDRTAFTLTLDPGTGDTPSGS